MAENPLGRYNPLLSRPTMAAGGSLGRFAVNDKKVPSTEVSDYVRISLAENTRRAYRADLVHFEAWGGTIPASSEMLASYLAEHAHAHSIATLSRRLASISKAHAAFDIPNPTRSELVNATLRGIRRKHGCAPKEATPLLKTDLFAVLDVLGDRVKDFRDRALLLLGFAGGFRRSELVGLDCCDVQRVTQGIVVHLRRSKTDQEGVGRKIGIPHGRTRHCPVVALDRWLARAGIGEGPIFRRVDRHGLVLSGRLSGEAVGLVVRERLAAAGIDPTGYSGHSLRAGLITSAAQMGVPSFKIRQQSGHASDAMLARYIRDSQLFSENAAGTLL